MNEIEQRNMQITMIDGTIYETTWDNIQFGTTTRNDDIILASGLVPFNADDLILDECSMSFFDISIECEPLSPEWLKNENRFEL